MPSKNTTLGVIVISIILFLAMCFLSGCTTGEITPEAASIEIPSPQNYVIDQSEVIDDGTEQALIDKLKDFDLKAQIAVVTIPTTGYLDERQYAIRLGEEWGVGHDGVDNGIIFLIVTEDRKVRIEVGRGLEGDLTDAEAGRILDQHVVPALKSGDWEKGIVDGVDAMIENL